MAVPGTLGFRAEWATFPRDSQLRTPSHNTWPCVTAWRGGGREEACISAVWPPFLWLGAYVCWCVHLPVCSLCGKGESKHALWIM